MEPMTRLFIKLVLLWISITTLAMAVGFSIVGIFAFFEVFSSQMGWDKMFMLLSITVLLFSISGFFAVKLDK